MQYSVPVETTTCVVCHSDQYSAESSGRDYMYGSCPDTWGHVRCHTCGHLYLNPRPTAEAANVIYPESYSSFTGVMARPSLISHIKRHVVMGRLKGVIGAGPRPRVLEIGCGEGQLLLEIRRAMPDAELAGVDFHFHPDFEALLRANDIEVIVGLAEDVQLPADHYDVVIMNQLIEHLWNVDNVLQACIRALKPGGLLSIETPNIDSYDRKLFRGGLWGDYYFPRHLNLFSPAGLKTVLERNGFEVVKSYNLMAPLCWIFTMNSVAGVNTGLAWMRRIFTATNVPAIGVFTVVDVLARLLGLDTSNQKAIARKPTSASAAGSPA